ncbi:membrane protein [Clostridiales bacterium PH28_bin88]|nr:membrane protein [Clostridiales bacterium PH28_bin88]
MQEETDPPALARLQAKVDQMADSLRKAGIAEYVEMMHRPRRVIIVNFWAGVARGVGTAVGFALLGALAVYLLRRIVVLNLPVISDFIADLIRMVQYQMQAS